jgi:hypothetical protein
MLRSCRLPEAVVRARQPTLRRDEKEGVATGVSDGVCGPLGASELTRASVMRAMRASVGRHGPNP